MRGSTTLRSFTYDGAGNPGLRRDRRATDARSGVTFTYTYNNANRLKTVSQSGNLLGTYTYNGFEQLIRRVITNSGTANGTIHTVHDQWGNVIAELDGTGATVREYIYLPEAHIAPTMNNITGIDRPLAVASGVNGGSPQLLMVHVDHLHRPVAMTNGARASAWSAVWTPWGAPYAITGAESLNARFPGQWFQLESGLHYNWNRQYDPTLGRYTQPDPIGLEAGPNVYAYANGRPTDTVDPEGENPAAGAGAAAAAIVIIARYCLKNPSKCRKNLLCPGMRGAKNIFCKLPGCKKWQRSRYGPITQSLAGAAMRSAEACLILRDAEEMFCELRGTTDHALTRPELVKKIEHCQKVCEWDSWHR